MAKTITIEYKGNKYTLEFTRDVVMRLERNGINIGEVDTKPATVISAFVYAGFVKNHKNIKEELVEEIYRAIPQKAEFLNTLKECYMDTISYLADEPEEGAEGNAVWTAN